MKKRLILLNAFYKKIRILAAFLLIVILVAELLFTYLLGTYRYFTLSDRSFKDIARDESTLYVMKFDSGAPEETVLSDLRAMPGIENVFIYRGLLGEYFYGETPVKIILTDIALFENYILLETDHYFSETGLEENIPQGIAAGNFIQKKSNSEAIEIRCGKDPFKIALLGRFVAQYYIPSFVNGGTAITTYDIMAPADNILFMKDTPEVRAFFAGKGIQRNYGNFFLTFKETATEEERQTVFEFLNAQDLFYSDAGTVLKNSKEVTEQTLRMMLPVPLYLTVLATVLTWCFSVLFLHKKMNLILNFYLCGCSKKRAYEIMTASLGLIGTLATVINIILLPLIWQKMQSGQIVIDHFFLDEHVLLYLICYWILLLLLSVLATFLLYRKKSVLSIRKKVDL